MKLSRARRDDGGIRPVLMTSAPTRARPPLTGWRISWTFTGDEKLFSLLTTKWTQSAQSVSATNVSWNGAVTPGGAVTITAVGSSANGVFGVTGLTCTPA
ncbi:cellulose binding domain-containing protein [Microbispora sp. NPDC046973]|uniref:cellulose binding domain-containing protein n=1 Tax=Microbispora sp. NPDC046973 TaxID=3155022 RepID=UPI0033DFD023